MDYVFFSNNKRFSKIDSVFCKIIITSNLEGTADFVLDYNSLTGAFDQGYNSFIMLLKLLTNMGVSTIAVAGADGYKDNNNYFDSSYKSSEKHDNKFNLAVADAIKKLGVNPEFITPSEYNR